MKTYRITILRYNPEVDREPHPESYEVTGREGWTVLDALHEIKWKKDGSLAFRRSCRHGICGSCAMTVDGKNRLACETQLDTLPPAFAVEPLRGLPVIKDLVVEMEPIYESVRRLRPFLDNDDPPPTDAERLQSQAERARLDGLYECILCACCTASCPVNQQKETEAYVGPAALVRAFRYLFDSRDEASDERIALLDHKNGAWGCQTKWKCTEVCPKEIPVTKQIGQIKKRIYDVKHPKE